MLLIYKVKHVGGILTLTTKRQEGNAPAKTGPENYDVPIHADLQAQLDNLRFHYGCLLGIVNAKKTDPKKVKPEMLEDLRTYGYFYQGKNNESIGIYGMIKQANGKWAVLTASAVPIEPAADGDGYEHMEALIEVVGNIGKELNSYLSGEKVGQAKQASLDLPDAKDDENNDGE